MKTIILSVMVFLFILMCLQEQDKQDKIIDDQHQEIIILTDKVFFLEELSDYALAMEQLLPPLTLLELKAMNEQIKQKRIATSGSPKGGD